MINTLGAINFTTTINLGAIILGLLILTGFAWASIKDKSSERWQKLYDLANHERQELQVEVAEARVVIAEQKEIISKLEALQMPARVMEMMTEGMRSINDHAASRQAEIRESIKQLAELVEKMPVIERLAKED